MSTTWKALFLLCLLAVTVANAASSPLDTLAQLPECASTCIIDAVIDSPCEATNQTCICANDELQAKATLCVMDSCSIRDSLFTKNVTLSSCDVAPRDETGEYAIMTYILAAFIGMSVFQRIAAKLWWKLSIELDDWCILLTTLIFTIPSLIINIHVLIANGMGRDIWTVPFDKITNFGSGFHAMAVLYFVQSVLIKLTLLIFYLRIFSTTDARKLLQGTLCFNVLFGIVYIMVAIFQCLPVGYLATRWDGEHEGSCIDINRFTWSHAAISIALDIWMLIIPLLQIRSLRLDWKKKVGATMMFCVGTTFTIVSILRLQVLVKFGDSANATWDYT